VVANRSPPRSERSALKRHEEGVQLEIKLETSKIDSLVAFGYLRQAERNDLKHICKALCWFLDRTLTCDVTSDNRAWRRK
jgi:hypothetical protein